MTPTKFQHAGLDWHPHTPGDPMPCPPDTKVRVLARGERDEIDEYVDFHYTANHWVWGKRENPSLGIVGWHPVEEQLEWPNAYTTVETGILRRVLDLLEAGDIEQAKHELRKELE